MRERSGPGPVAAVDRHSARVAALRRAIFDSDAVTDRSARAAAASGGEGLSPLMGSYLTKVREASYRVSDSDIAALREAGHSEEEIFELTVAAAFGTALRILDAGFRALRGDR